MTNNKSLIFMVVAALGLGLAWLFAAWAGAGLQQAQAAVGKVEQAEKGLVALKEQLTRWENAGSQTLGSVEPVALNAIFLPAELPKSAQLLAGLYADHGYFNLRQFSLSWGDNDKSDSGSVAQMTVNGEKIFIGQHKQPAAPAVEGGH